MNIYNKLKFVKKNNKKNLLGEIRFLYKFICEWEYSKGYLIL